MRNVTLSQASQLKAIAARYLRGIHPKYLSRLVDERVLSKEQAQELQPKYAAFASSVLSSLSFFMESPNFATMMVAAQVWQHISDNGVLDFSMIESTSSIVFSDGTVLDLLVAIVKRQIQVAAELRCSEPSAGSKFNEKLVQLWNSHSNRKGYAKRAIECYTRDRIAYGGYRDSSKGLGTIHDQMMLWVKGQLEGPVIQLKNRSAQ